MAFQAPPVAASPPATVTPAPEAAGFDERWAAWQAKGAAQDRALRRQMAIVAPILIMVAIVIILYTLIGG